jgi:hypothetical protein
LLQVAVDVAHACRGRQHGWRVRKEALDSACNLKDTLELPSVVSAQLQARFGQLIVLGKSK